MEQAEDTASGGPLQDAASAQQEFIQMQKSTFITAAAIGALAFAGAAYGQTCDRTFNGSQSNLWNVAANWDDQDGADGVPTAADRVCIPADKTCEVDIATAVADTIQIDPKGAGSNPGKLIILTTRKLTLDNSTAEDSVIKGTLELQGSGTIRFDVNDHDVTGGTGSAADEPSEIVGSDSDSSAIHIQSSKTLMLDSNMTVSGRMKIQRDPSDTGVATLKNEGIVLADGAGILELADNLALEDASGGTRWKADGGSATLLFSRQQICPAALAGNFAVDTDGTLEFDKDVHTTGTFSCSNSGNVSGTGTGTSGVDCNTKPIGGTAMSGC